MVFIVFLKMYFLLFVLNLVVNTSASDCLERLVSAMTCRKSRLDRRVRSWCSVDRGELHKAIEDSTLRQPLSSSLNVSDMFGQYDAVLCGIADCLALELIIHARPCRLSPWFDANCLECSAY